MALSEVVKDLLESGVHFGHLSKHWNPKMKKFIFGKKKNVYIVDLEKTAQKLEEAKQFVKELSVKGEKILFVATKKQLRDLIKEMASSCDMLYIAERWVGGFLTNFSTIRGRIKRYIDLIEKRKNGEFDKMPRKEVVRLNRMLIRMEKNYSGVTQIEGLPGCVFVVDPKKEAACVNEAFRSGIPIMALIDTDADPDTIDYPIPGNDDAIKSVRCIMTKIVEAIKEGSEISAQKARENLPAAKDENKESKLETKETDETVEVEPEPEKDAGEDSKEN